MEQTNNKTGNACTSVMDAPAISVDQMMQDVIGILVSCYDQAPLGTLFASEQIKPFLESVAFDVDADYSHPLVQRVAELRALVGDDGHKKLSDAMQNDKLKVQQEAAEVATRVFEHIDAPPFSDANSAVEFNLNWIVDALEKNVDFDTEPDSGSCETVLREAYKLKLTISGAPDIVSEMRFLISQELLISRVLQCVPATTLYSFWISLKPSSEDCIKYHELVARQLEELPAEKWSLEDHANATIAFWDAVAETVEYNGRDAIMRILSQQATDYLRERISSLRYHLGKSKEPWAEPACKRAGTILANMSVKPVFPHAELSVWDLSPESDNFEKTQASTAASKPVHHNL